MKSSNGSIGRRSNLSTLVRALAESLKAHHEKEKCAQELLIAVGRFATQPRWHDSLIDEEVIDYVGRAMAAHPKVMNAARQNYIQCVLAIRGGIPI